jgi:hypothetical protein
LPLAGVLVIAAAAVVLGAAVGGVGALGNPIVSLVAGGLVVAAAVATSRRAVLWFVLIGALVVTGVAQLYLPGSRIVRYVVPLASLALLMHWWLDGVSGRARPLDEPVPAPVAWGLLFVVLALVSSLLNMESPAIRLLGLKNYFQMWGLFLGVALLRWDGGLSRNLAQGALLLALLQLPFALHQYVYLVPRRVGLGDGIVPVDVVAGTFGAERLGGGANAVLAAYLVIVAAGLLAFWKNGLVGGATALALAVLVLTPLLVNQAKIAALYLPLAFLVVFRRDVVARPLRFLAAALGTALALAVLLTALALNNPSGRDHTWSELVADTVARQTASVEERRGQYNELTRITAVTFWVREHVDAPALQTLFGHGPGASFEFRGNVVDTADTLAWRRYPGLRIGYTGVSALLWDTGLLGLAAVLGMFASAFVMAGRLANASRASDPRRAALLDAAQAAVAILALSLAHKDFFVVNLPYQALTLLVFGYVANAWLETRRAGA